MHASREEPAAHARMGRRRIKWVRLSTSTKTQINSIHPLHMAWAQKKRIKWLQPGPACCDARPNDVKPLSDTPEVIEMEQRLVRNGFNRGGRRRAAHLDRIHPH
jgi:hypothetical protein